MITGIVLFSLHILCKLAPPRGMIMSICSSRRSKWVTHSLSGLFIYCTDAAGRPDFSKAICIILTKAIFELNVSLPPRKILALPVFKQRDAISMVTLGRAS